MRFPRFGLLFAAFIMAACAATPQPLPTPVPTGTPIPLTPTPLPHRAPLLRVAVLGETTTTNVWALFDEVGADYWNYATQANYWPSLYHLTSPSSQFEPATAIGDPSPIVCDSETCTATVTLQSELSWTDGSPFTADDVVFTAKTALRFRLGLNWLWAYNPDMLDYVDALDESTVKFYFKGMPGVADWQYGVLQGPIVNQAYWKPRIVRAVNLLPDESLLPAIQELEIEFADMQSQVESLNLSLNTMAPASTVYQDTSKQAKRLQEELNSVYNKLEKSRIEYQTKLAEARAVLFSLANANEPTLGPWMFASRIEGKFENTANLGTPFGDPWFEKVLYITYSSEKGAVRALLDDEVDLILSPDGLSPDSIDQIIDPEITLRRNITRSARFLVFNQANPYLADPALHRALACVLDPQVMLEEMSEDGAPLPGFALDDSWRNQKIFLPCTGVSGDDRLSEAVEYMKAAGYSWREEPEPGKAGKVLRAPEGTLMPHFSLLSPSMEVDVQRAEAAHYIARQAGMLGLSVEVNWEDADELLYTVFGSGEYEMALLGWRLSAYPAYLCEWFTPLDKNPFAYTGSGLRSKCEMWLSTSDLEEAKSHASRIQSILIQDLPMIPLYSMVRVDAYRNVRYPFDSVIDGLLGFYGAPELAIPVPK